MSKVRVGVTGYSGFIGLHLIERLGRDPEIIITRVEDDCFKVPDRLKNAIRDCDCIIHLAGMNRGQEKDVYSTNVFLAQALISALEKLNIRPHLIFASSTHTINCPDSAFGRSKKAAGDLLKAWGSRSKADVNVLVIPNVFGDGGKPFYNSVVATFCYQLSHGEKPKIIQDQEVEFIFINDLIESIYQKIREFPKGIGDIKVQGAERIKVSAVLALLESYRDSFFTSRTIPSLTDPFHLNLYNTFISYLDYGSLTRFPEIHRDHRGELYEIIKLGQGGQIFYSMTKPGIIRGNHYHTRKIERFCVIGGMASIRLRRVGTKELKEFKVVSDQPSFIEVPIFHAHHIENTGKEDLRTLFWCNELYDPQDADTFFEEVVGVEK